MGRRWSFFCSNGKQASSIVSTYSYTQISQYLSCPRRYRYRYVDGWQEKETHAGMLFGRAFEAALGALFRRDDCGQVLFDEWSVYRNVGLGYSRGDTWHSMLHEGIRLLERFVQDDRVRVRNPRRNLQVKLTRRLSASHDFVAYIDAIGELDHNHSIIDWKTSAARYPDQPAGLLALDPQLVCYSWVTGEQEVAFVVFVRKRLPEVQYLRTTITDEQRQQFGQLVEETIGRIEAGQFLPRSGIRFPQNGCLSCPFLGLCLGNDRLAESKLNRCPGAEGFAWLDELRY